MDDEIKTYYESIRQIYDDIRSWKPPKAPWYERIADGFLIFFVFIFALSLIPILPVAFLTASSYLQIHIVGFQLYPATVSLFLIFWGLGLLASILLLALFAFINHFLTDKIKSKSTPRKDIVSRSTSIPWFVLRLFGIGKFLRFEY